MQKISKISKSQKDTDRIAAEFIIKILKKSQRLKHSAVVALSGPLGAGKTAFTQAVGKLLGIKNKMASPTFVIIRKYKIIPDVGHQRIFKMSDIRTFSTLFHIDAYRLKSHNELLKLGWEEIIADPKHLIFIEWPENVKKALPQKRSRVKISHTKEGHRKFVIG